MYIGLYTVYEKAVIPITAHNPCIFHDFYGNNIFFNLRHFDLRPIYEKHNWE
jgi:hypothetical protein